MQAKVIFGKYDRGKSGYMSTRELVPALKELHLPTETAQAARLVLRSGSPCPTSRPHRIPTTNLRCVLLLPSLLFMFLSLRQCLCACD